MPPESTFASSTVVLESPAELPSNNASGFRDLKYKKGSTYRTLWGTFDLELKFTNIFFIFLVHFWALYSFMTYNYLEQWRTVIWAFIIGGISGFGVTGGAHRYWTHRCFKANLPLRIILMLCYTSAGQNSLFDWVRDHRVHHKFSETDADPHNAKRGFFFAHVGWLMMKKHPEVLKKGKQMDFSDLFEDPVFRFHQKYFTILKIMFCFVIPTAVPMYFWNSTFYNSFITLSVARYTTALNFTWLVNSAAHLWGNKPYDKKINPSENLIVSIVALGEGWHNYHHTFPWDYKAAELGQYSVNLTTFYLDLFAKIGWAYDLKEPSADLVKKVILNNGDGTHPKWGHTEIPESADKFK